MDSHCISPSGTGVTGLLLKNGDFVACVYRGLADDFATARAAAIAAKVIKATRKKFSKLVMKVSDREISAWDYFCYSQHAGARANADKFISDYIRLALIKRIEDLPAAELHLLALADIPFDTIDEETRIEPEMVFRRVQIEVLRRASEHGSTLAIQGGHDASLAPPVRALPIAGQTGMAAQNSNANGASPT